MRENQCLITFNKNLPLSSPPVLYSLNHPHPPPKKIQKQKHIKQTFTISNSPLVFTMS